MDLVLPRLGDRTFTEPRDNMAASSGVRPTGAARRHTSPTRRSGRGANLPSVTFGAPDLRCLSSVADPERKN